jgi:hypothetical protein
MAQTFGVQSAKVLGVTTSTPAPGFVHGTSVAWSEQIVLGAANAIGDTIVVGLVPKGAQFMGGTVTVDTSLSTSTISLGTASSAAKYMALTAFTTVDVPVNFGKTAAQGTTLTANDTVILTIAALALPAAGNIKILLEYCFD